MVIMDFITSIGKSKKITIDGVEYTASVLSVADLSEASDLIYYREQSLNKEAKKMTLYETAINLVFHNPHLAMFAALNKNHPDIKYEVVCSMNLVQSEAVELLAYLVGIELEKKTS